MTRTDFRRGDRSALRQFALLLVALGGFAIALSTTPVTAQAEQAWQPFKERDERATERARLKPREVPTDRGASNGAGRFAPPATATPAAPAFTPPPQGIVERIDLDPPHPTTESAAPPVQASAAPAAASAMGAGAPGLPSLQAAPQVPLRETPADRSALGASPLRAIPPVPVDFWRGVDMKMLETAIQGIDVPPRSLALHALWQTLMTADGEPPAGGQGPAHFTALQLEALYRSGLIDTMTERLAARPAADDPLMTAFRTRRDLAAAETDAACAGAKALAARRDSMPKMLRGEAHLLAGYCAAVNGNTAAAGLSAELAREEEVDAGIAIQALDALAAPQGPRKPTFQLPKRLTVLDYRLLELLGPLDAAAILPRAEPALLVALSRTAGTPPALAVAGAEAAANLHAIDGEALAAVYRRVAGEAKSGNDPGVKRATQFAALAAEPQAVKRLAAARPVLDDAKRAGLAMSMARALATLLTDITPMPDLGPAAATGAEIALAAGNHDLARRFAAAHPAAAIWAPLAELSDPAFRGVSDAGLRVLDDAVRRNRFQPAESHRLATVLDALDTNVPIPLWEAASRTPQPSAGHLPETGVLPQLQDAAAKKDLARAMMLVIRTIGPRGPDAAHLIALGDSLRALRRAGLEDDARRLAFEALYTTWPRG